MRKVLTHDFNDHSLIGLFAFDSMNAIDSFGERFRIKIKLTRVDRKDAVALAFLSPLISRT